MCVGVTLRTILLTGATHMIEFFQANLVLQAVAALLIIVIAGVEAIAHRR